MAAFKVINRWYNGDRKIKVIDLGPDSAIMAFTTSHVEYHWGARIARVLAGFYSAHWKWIWTTAIAACSLITIYK